MRKRNLTKTIMLMLLFFSSSGFPNNIIPSSDEIQIWWEQNSKEKMEIGGEPLPIGLRNNEIAFLIPVYFYSRGRNDIDHTILVRPAIKSVREVSGPVSRDSVIHDLNHDGISEIETVDLGSGQGTTNGEKSIVQFDDWTPIILHRKEFYDNLGCCGPPKMGCGKCKSQEVNWKFIDLDKDGKNDLIEEVIIKEGVISNKINTHETIIKKFMFNNNMFECQNCKQINARILQERLLLAGVSQSKFSIDDDSLPVESGGVLDRVSEYWRIRNFNFDDWKFSNEKLFATESEACVYFFDKTMPFYVPWNNHNFFKQVYRLDR